MDASLYKIRDTSQIDTPALLYYKDYILQNTKNTINLAGGAERLWPHVKSHKMREMILMQLSMGINRFKCATIAELQMVAACGAKHILMAYPLVGPYIARFLRVAGQYPHCQFYAIGDDITQLANLSAASLAVGQKTKTLLDINMGMNRTGVSLQDANALYTRAAALPGLEMVGMHCYDGHCNDPDPEIRKQRALSSIERVHAIRAELESYGQACQYLVMGGTPSFPIHAAYPNVFLSPGTIFLGDYRYASDLTDLSMIPAAVLMTRVVSHPAEGLFTLDLGTKAISTDMAGRGHLLGVEGAEALFQSEEHWVYRMPERKAPPAIGDVLYVIPMHICPTTALYASVYVAEDHQVVDCWDVTARNRSIGV